jgi:enoyl-CoA hydratase/carnithine racemase
VASSDTEAAAILANIERHPIAATVLVQVLRVTPNLSLQDGLTLESLAYATLQAGSEHKAWLSGQSRPAPRPADTSDPIVVERDDTRLSLTLNRPDRRNALSVELRDALCEALGLVLADDDIETVSISGAGRCFSIGGDLDEFGTAPDPATAHIVRSIRLPARLLSRCADRIEFRLHGACIGAGIELPAFGRRVVAARKTFFQLPELAFGLIPGAGGCVSIPRRIGRQRTAWLALTGRRINAATALAWGLVDALAA